MREITTFYSLLRSIYTHICVPAKVWISKNIIYVYSKLRSTQTRMSEYAIKPLVFIIYFLTFIYLYISIYTLY